MSKILFTEKASTPTTPTSGRIRLYVNTSGKLCTVNDTGGVTVLDRGVFGTEYQTYTSTSTLTTTSSSYSTAYTWTTTSIPAGTYHLMTFMPASQSSAGSDMKFKIKVDGSDVGLEYVQKPKQYSSQRIPTPLVANFTTASTATHTITLQFASEIATLYTVSIYGVIMELWRVS